MQPMDQSRRRLLATFAALPVAGIAGVAAMRLGVHAAVLRPGGRGTSSRRCAQCGGGDHTMLDAACPAAPQVV